MSGLPHCSSTINHDMQRTDWIEHCETVNRLLKQIREQVSPLFTPEEDKTFEEFLAANELGLALDFLCWKIEDTGNPISHKNYDLLADAGSMMKMSPNHWTKLKRLAH
jgi:hypothetical protein